MPSIAFHSLYIHHSLTSSNGKVEQIDNNYNKTSPKTTYMPTNNFESYQAPTKQINHHTGQLITITSHRLLHWSLSCTCIHSRGAYLQLKGFTPLTTSHSTKSLRAQTPPQLLPVTQNLSRFSSSIAICPLPSCRRSHLVHLHLCHFLGFGSLKLCCCLLRESGNRSGLSFGPIRCDELLPLGVGGHGTCRGFRG